MKLLSSLLLLAVSASAEPVHTPRSGNACTEGSGFEGRTMVLWVTDKTNPDEAECLARLPYAKCEVGRADDAPVETGLPHYSLDDAPGIAQFILEQLRIR